ncbi:hypothetical protein M514_26841, partial [Trichuris suis]
MSKYDGCIMHREEMECEPPHPSALHSPTSAYDMNRVHEELEKLNIATDVINKLELQLDEAQAIFRDVQSSWTQRLSQMNKRLGSCIDKSRPYYEARIKVLEAQQEAHKAALRFERANRMHAVAKQQVSLTQESLNRQGTENVDPACLEVLNHHIHRVNEAEVDRLQSENEHKRISQQVEEATRNVSVLQSALKRSIQKSKPYFEARVEFTKVLQNQKSLIQRLEAEIRQKKADYNASLRRLEEISEEIHEKRSLGKRDPGVGSESPGPPCTSLSEASLAQRKAAVESFLAGQEERQSVNVSAELPNACSAALLTQGASIPLAVEAGDPQKGARLISKSPVGIDDVICETAESSSQWTSRECGESANNNSAPFKSQLAACPASQGTNNVSYGLNSGIILLAHELVAQRSEPAQVHAFQFPHEELDVEYRTTPEGLVLSGSSTPPAGSSEVNRTSNESVLPDEQVKMLMDS